MTLEHVLVEAAIRRMQIYGRGLTIAGRVNLAHVLRSGRPIRYVAYNSSNEPIGTTTVTPEDFPVTLVTEVNTD